MYQTYNDKGKDLKICRWSLAHSDHSHRANNGTLFLQEVLGLWLLTSAISINNNATSFKSMGLVGKVENARKREILREYAIFSQNIAFSLLDPKKAFDWNNFDFSKASGQTLNNAIFSFIWEWCKNLASEIRKIKRNSIKEMLWARSLNEHRTEDAYRWPGPDPGFFLKRESSGFHKAHEKKKQSAKP